MLMYNCNCNQNHSIPPLYGAQDTAHSCIDRPTSITLRTTVIPASAGSDLEGTFAPKPGAYYNTVVSYQATGAVFIYDSNGVYTQIEPDNYAELVAKVNGLAEALETLRQKEQEDVDNLQENINQLANKEAEDVENLQTNINGLANELEEYKNSPDVRFIVDTYAALNALDKSSIGDQDYARVLQDETHDNASTYYQFSIPTQTWTYIGQTGPYYTKEQVDDKFNDIDVAKLNSLANIKGIGENLELTEDGTLNAMGGGGGASDVEVLSTYTALPSTEAVYNASYINSRLNGSNVNIGSQSTAQAQYGFVVGSASHADYNYAMALGLGTYANANQAIAIGGNAVASSYKSVAIGTSACTDSTRKEVSFGHKVGDTTWIGDIATDSETKYLANVTAGILDTDAVNVSQLNAALARIEALEAEVAALKNQ